MSKGKTIELDAYRLAKYADQHPCYICQQPNHFDAELCRHCQAPMALANQAANLKVEPKLIATIGASGVGKTVYLGMLMDMVSRQSTCMQVLARGAFSVTIQQTTASALERGRFPDKTPNEPDRWNWVHCQIRRNKRPKPVELIMPDMAGEALLEEVEHPDTFQVIRSFLGKCAGAIVMIDATKLQSGHLDQDFFTMKLLSYLAELNNDPKKGWLNRPLAVVFSKADKCEECFVDPAAYAQKHAAGLWRHCQERFHQHRFFAASVAGSCAYREDRYDGRIQVPLRVEPRGIIEPFEWLFEQIRGRGT